MGETDLRLGEILASPETAVLVVDVQRDFMEGGALAVHGATYQEYVPAVQKFVDACRAQKLVITQSQDWHPADHSSFASNNGKEVMTVQRQTLPNGKEIDQMMWPDHCVQGTEGAKLLIEAREGEFVKQKGADKEVDSYSAFFDAAGRETGFTSHLKAKGIKNVVTVGVASDYCVNFCAADAAKCEFRTYAVTDLCRSVDPNYDAVAAFEKNSVICVTSEQCYRAFGASGDV